MSKNQLHKIQARDNTVCRVRENFSGGRRFEQIMKRLMLKKAKETNTAAL